MGRPELFYPYLSFELQLHRASPGEQELALESVQSGDEILSILMSPGPRVRRRRSLIRRVQIEEGLLGVITFEDIPEVYVIVQQHTFYIELVWGFYSQRGAKRKPQQVCLTKASI